MLIPLLLIGVVAFLAGQASKAGPVIGALGPAAPVLPPAATRPGERIRFELGRPYRIVATSNVPPDALRKLAAWLSLGTYHAQRLSIRQLPAGLTEICLCFVAPKTEVVPIGQPLDWDLGDGRLRLVLRSVQSLDARPLTIGAAPSRRIAQLRAQAKAELAMSRKLGRPVGQLYASVMNRAMDLQAQGEARPSELPALFDELRNGPRDDAAEIEGLPLELSER